MAFQPQGGQEVQNRKLILQDLQERKRQMMNQQSAMSSSSSGSISSGHPARPEPTVMRGDGHQLSVNQRQALEQAHAMSSGFYVPQDSIFGNLILPVIPRLENDS